MATNPPAEDGQRNGVVRGRSQVFNPGTPRWTKRDTETGRFMDQKTDGKPFKGATKRSKIWFSEEGSLLCMPLSGSRIAQRSRRVQTGRKA